MQFTPQCSSKSLIKSFNQQVSSLKRNIDNGRFADWSYRKRQYVVGRILHLLKLMRTQGIKVAGTLGISLLSCLSMNAQFGAPFTTSCETNPFEDLELVPFPMEDETIYGRQVLTGDLDGDGDEDLLVISSDGTSSYFLQYFEAENGAFIELIGEDNPLEVFNDDFEDMGASSFLNFTLGDASLNGRLDLVFGESKGEVVCYVNAEDGWSISTDKEFTTEDDSFFSNVSFANIDDDCDDELIVLNSFGSFPGQGEEGEPDTSPSVYDIQDGAFVDSPEMAAMFSNVPSDPDFPTTPYFFDYDDDGIDELIVVNYGGIESPSIDFYIKEDGVYELASDAENPFSDYDFDEENDFNIPLIEFGDLDGDGELNMYVGFKSNSPETADEILCINSSLNSSNACLDDPGVGGAVPTLSEWGIIILGLIVMIFGVLGIKEKFTRSLRTVKAKDNS